MKNTLYNRKKMLIIALISVIILIAGLLIVPLKLFYPFHTIIGYSTIIISIITFIFSIRKYFKILKNLESLNTLQTFILDHRIIISFILAFIILAIIVYTTIPFAKNPFKDMSPDEIHNQIQEDLNSSSLILDHLEISGRDLLNSGLLEKEKINADEREKLIKLWTNFLISVMESELMTDTYSYFHFIPAISAPEDHAKAFMIAYSLYIKKYELVSEIISVVQSNDTLKKALNDKINKLELRNIYKNISYNYYLPKTVFRINFGQAYLNTFIDLVYGKNLVDDRYLTLVKSAKNDYLSLKDKLGDTLINSAKVSSDTIEKKMFDVWFPVQINTAKALGHTYISDRENKFITIEQINELRKTMQPGDIMLQRRNWYASNIGIPGFWAHAALYTGNIEEMDNFFSSEFPYNNYEKFSDLLKAEHINVYNKFFDDQNGFKQSVIEGKEPGIILQPLEVSANADYLVVLRPKLEKKDIMLSLIRSFSNFGKPYDFNFDFDTRDEMVCSELVYDAYQGQEGKAGINFPLSMFNGRKIMAPVDIAVKFKEEYRKGNEELEFVYFLDGNEEEKKAISKGVEEFIKTLDRPKYSFFLD